MGVQGAELKKFCVDFVNATRGRGGGGEEFLSAAALWIGLMESRSDGDYAADIAVELAMCGDAWGFMTCLKWLEGRVSGACSVRAKLMIDRCVCSRALPCCYLQVLPHIFLLRSCLRVAAAADSSCVDNGDFSDSQAAAAVRSAYRDASEPSRLIQVLRCGRDIGNANGNCGVLFVVYVRGCGAIAVHDQKNHNPPFLRMPSRPFSPCQPVFLYPRHDQTNYCQ